MKSDFWKSVSQTSQPLVGAVTLTQRSETQKIQPAFLISKSNDFLISTDKFFMKQRGANLANQRPVQGIFRLLGNHIIALKNRNNFFPLISIFFQSKLD